MVSLRYRPTDKILDLKIISGRSHCVNCGKTLAWYELIPILSFIVQKGRCRSCGKRLFWQYPLVEILSGIIFVAVPWHFNNFQFLISNFQSISNFQLLIAAIWVLIFLLFLLLSIIDFRHYIIPDSINLSLAILGIVLIIFNFQFLISNQFSISNFQLSNSFLGHYSSLFNFWSLSIINNQWSVVVSHLAATLFGMLFFWLIIFLSKGKAMGWGDFKLVGALGLIFGWPDVIMVLISSFLVGGIFCAVLLIKGRKKMKDAVPFGPFLVIGSGLTFFFGYQIIDAYFKLFNL